MVTECFPVKTRGKAVAINASGTALGVCLAFSTGRVFGTEFLQDNWKWFLISPAVLSFLRLVLIILFYNHKTPKQLVISAKTYDDVDLAVGAVLEKYYDSANDIKAAKSEYQTMMANGLAESGFFSLLKYNLGNKKTMLSFFAVMLFNIFPNVAGNAFTDNYSSVVFDQIGAKGFGYEVNFYCGFVVLASAILAGLTLDSYGRRNIVISGCLLMIVSNWLMGIGFYYLSPSLVFASTIGVNIASYYGNAGIYYVYMNEISEPFVMGLGIAMLWASRTVVMLGLPRIYNEYPLPMVSIIQCIMGILCFVVMRPLYVETKGKSTMQIKEDYAN
jgi:MFS family permease